jgi:CRP-like cAMP-binding protein
VVTQLEPVSAPAGTQVIVHGARDDTHWYLVDQGELEVHVDGFLVNELGRGSGFGELALLRRTPRTATVRARTDVSLLALDRNAFLEAVAGPDLQFGGEGEQPVSGTQDPADLLGRTMLLQGIGRRALEHLARDAHECAFAASEQIIVEGETDDCYYVLLKGRATVLVGTERRGVLQAGDCFGEIAVLHKVPRSASVIADEPCLLLSIPGEALRVAAQERGGALGKLAGPSPAP